tara:strand:+ start:1427 stop:1846 length:420 start_codon:yes stop_codon:yes gene_type:complete
MGKSNDFPESSSADDIAPDLLQSFLVQMQSCTREDVAVCLEKIASTFQVKVPDDLGLTVYFDMLCDYPKFIIDHCTYVLLAEYQYPRLPIPSEFIKICDPIYEEHKAWLIKINNNFRSLELWKKHGSKLITNKYLDYNK